MEQPRGIRNNNPGNIEWGSPWQGLKPEAERTDKRFAQFVDAAYGIRALATTLITYQDKRRADDGSPIDTVFEAISRWAPKNENNTSAYAIAVAKVLERRLGRAVSIHDVLDFHDYDVLFAIVSGIIRHENGQGPLSNDNSWYDEAVLKEGLRRAGVVVKKPAVAGVPVTKETAAAGTAAVIGVGQIADVLPQVSAAIDRSQDNLTSGQWVRVILGIATIGVAVWIAYAQIKKRQAGAV